MANVLRLNETIKGLVLIVSCVLLFACAHTKQPAVTDPSVVFDDSVFPNASDIDVESYNEIFFLHDEAKAFVDDAINGLEDDEAQVYALVTGIFDHANFSLLYDASANTTASQTFDNKTANCLSLTIMAYSMSQHAKLRAVFQDVVIPEFWTREQGIKVLNGHVNLLVRPAKGPDEIAWNEPNLTVDFDPHQNLDMFRKIELSKAQVVAMFYSNVAANHIVNKRYDHAYAYLKQALLEDPNYTGAYVNLGFIYKRMHRLDLAEKAYLAAVNLNESYLTGWDNLIALYRETDRDIQADELKSKLIKQRLSNPYYHIMLAEAALEKDELQKSIQHYQDAIKLDDSRHHFYFGIAKVYQQLGNIKMAKRNLILAKRNTDSKRLLTEYSSMLDRLSDTYD
ncbi:tetratricopeptide repeat protein [Ningiella sp. W23]|uniref:tetratricopeptide repeat protein n=1 Tax=Ningiella sp. W23 TaxID=3023715 RepID=UPI0037564787